MIWHENTDLQFNTRENRKLRASAKGETKGLLGKKKSLTSIGFSAIRTHKIL